MKALATYIDVHSNSISAVLPCSQAGIYAHNYVGSMNSVCVQIPAGRTFVYAQVGFSHFYITYVKSYSLSESAIHTKDSLLYTTPWHLKDSGVIVRLFPCTIYEGIADG